MQYIKQLNELNTSDLPEAGGKAANLGALISAGLPVPLGFCVTINAYMDFVKFNGIEQKVNSIIHSIDSTDMTSLEKVSVQIRQLFLEGQIPNRLGEEIQSAYVQLNREVDWKNNEKRFYAVRSSATVEDLPEMSFAGQHDTYLNIDGNAAILESIVHCWASLWTARAIGYRLRNAIEQEDIALAVIIQQMVQSDVSGVLFTANPLTGKRSDYVIDATIGLGEALVSGQVEPDHYVYDCEVGEIVTRKIGAKGVSIRGQSNGGTMMVTESASGYQALPDDKIIELIELGRRIVAYFKFPQDIEWAMAEGKIFLVQSRPITSLYPIPGQTEDVSQKESLKVWFSFGSVQGMLDPYTPLGQDMFPSLAVAIRKRLKYPDFERQDVFVTSGERLYVNLTPFMKSHLGRKIFPKIIAEIDPALIKPMASLFNDSRLKGETKSLGLKKQVAIFSFLMPFAFNVIYNMITPINGRMRLNRTITSVITVIKKNAEKVSSLSDCLKTLDDSILLMQTRLIPCLIPAVLSGQIPLQIVKGMSVSLPDGTNLAMELTRGLPYNVTTEMDLLLWATATKIKSDDSSFQLVSNTDAKVLAGIYLEGKLPPIAQDAVENFMGEYGMRGVAEIDLGRPRWKEDPKYIMQMLKNYLQIEMTAVSPEENFNKGRDKSKLAEAQLVDGLKGTKNGFIKSHIAKFMIKRIRELGGLRELPKFSVMKIFVIFRDLFITFGRQMKSEGILKQADDIFYLHFNELQSVASGSLIDVQTLVAGRKNTYENEKRRKRIPRMVLSDGTTFYEGMVVDSANENNVIEGSPVSAGTVEGIVRVVTNPFDAQLSYGEIMVCVASDPAWTPLFLTAGGLIMEVGGMMTHGSVVAREYGIPAIVGVDQATTKLKTGQKVRLDGSSGKVYIVEENK